MKTSNLPEHSLKYQTNRSSASVKINRKTRESGKSMALSANFSQFSATVRSETLESFNKQGAFLADTFPSNPLDTASDAGAADSNQPVAPLSIFDEDHYWGVKKTSERISNFVLQGAGDDLEKLKMGREGVLKGFKAAENAWGGSLPDISHETLAKSLEAIDEKIRELGGSVVDLAS